MIEDSLHGATPEFWEPWTPKIGQRVRVVLSGECQMQGSSDSPKEQLRGEAHGGEKWNGKTGTVVRINWRPELTRQGHRFTVDWDEPEWISGWPRGIKGDNYAAIELEPLD